MNKFNLPNYIVNIDDTVGMSAISLVEYPAIEVNFITLAEDKPLKLVLADESKHELFGPAILADVPIYRRQGTYEYTITFTADIIKQIIEKFSLNNFQNMVNLQHDENEFVDSVIMTEIYIKDSVNGINPIQFTDVPDGSLFVRYKVTDETLWNKIKTSGKLNGFSIEIECLLDEDKLAAVDPIDKYIEELLK